MKRLLVLFVLAVILLPALALSEEAVFPFCINEICSKNGGSFLRDGNSADYIELLNRTGKTLPLDGFFLSDKKERLDRFSLSGYVIPAESCLILLADKKELPFKLSADGGEELFLSDSEGNILQHVILPPLERDTTYSLQQDGQWHITSPTPMEANASGLPYVQDTHGAAPVFSHPSGFYEDPFDLILTCGPASQIYYTLDGSVPTANSLLYSAPIRVDDTSARPNCLSARTDITVEDAVPPAAPVRKAMVIRAIAVDQAGNCSPEVVHTYFVGYGDVEAFQGIPFLSVIAAPESLFDEKDGIYVRGKVYENWLRSEPHNTALPVQQIPTNYRMRGREWEIPVTLQWFDAKRQLRLSQGAGLRIHGNWSREGAKKSFNLYARKDYGSKCFEYSILPQRSVKERLVLRANLGTDALLHALLAKTGIMTSPSMPCMAFVNGEFWGFYEMREKQDERDIAAFHHLDEDQLVVIKNGDLIAGELPGQSEAKDAREYYANLLSEIAALNPATDAGYRACGELIDLDNYVSYTAAIAYLNDSDYMSNYTLWRLQEGASGPPEYRKWHWIFQDLDNCCFSFQAATEMISLLPDDGLFALLWQNKSFQAAFLTRIMDYANVELAADAVMNDITPVISSYAPFLKEDSLRYPDPQAETVDRSQSEIKSLGAFFASRREKTVSALKKYLGVATETGTLVLSNLPDGMALSVNSHPAYISGDSFACVYFDGTPVTFQAGEIPGYRFSGWYEEEQLLSSDAVLEITVRGHRTISPVYEPQPVVVSMDQRSPLIRDGSSAFKKRLEASANYCLLTADASVSAEFTWENAVTFIPDPSNTLPQGLTLSLPLYGYTGVSGSFTLESGQAISWRVLCGNEETAPLEQPADVRLLPDEKLLVSYVIPEQLLNADQVNVRLEAVPSEESGSFTLWGFGLYGNPVDAALSDAREYIRIVRKINAPKEFMPALEVLEEMRPDQLRETISVLRQRLQQTLARQGVTTAKAFDADSPALEGLQSCPAVIVTRQLVDAFYNQESLSVPVSAEGIVYLYEWLDGSLIAQGQTVGSDGQVTLPKEPGKYLLLNQPLQNIRFHVQFSEDPVPQNLLESALYGIKPRNTLWMEIQTFTVWQEEASIQLPSSWANAQCYIYRLEDDSLIDVTGKDSPQHALRLVPQTGKYLLMDENLASLSERAERDRKQAEEIRRQVTEREEKRQQTIRTLLMCGAVLVLVSGVAVLTVLVRRRKKSNSNGSNGNVF